MDETELEVFFWFIIGSIKVLYRNSVTKQSPCPIIRSKYQENLPK